MSSELLDIINRQQIKKSTMNLEQQYDFIKEYVTSVLKTYPELELFFYNRIRLENVLARRIQLDQFGYVIEGPTIITDVENFLLCPRNENSILNIDQTSLLIIIILFVVLLIIKFKYINYRHESTTSSDSSS